MNVDIFYLHPDHLGTPRAITRSQAVGTATTGPNAINKATWRHESDPFGTSIATSAPNENPQNITGTQTQIKAGSMRLDNGFPGQLRDRESGKSYNYFRDYDPAIGRYSTSDPIGFGGGLNTFGYAGATPTMAVDAFGLQMGIPWPVPAPPITPPITSQPYPGTNAPPDTSVGGDRRTRDGCCVFYRNVYEGNDGKHGSSPRGNISAGPASGQATLDTSVPSGPDQRIGYDPVNGIVIFRVHRTDEKNCIKYWHGYIVGQRDLTPNQWRSGRDAGFPNWPRKPQ